MRGRVSAVNNIFIVASNDLGGLESGFTAWAGRPDHSVVGGGIATILIVLGRRPPLAADSGHRLAPQPAARGGRRGGFHPPARIRYNRDDPQPRKYPRKQAVGCKSQNSLLEDGTVFTGKAFGADGEVDGEVCFNTSMTGYQEILTDPSYRGQIVTMTYPEIGNYGVNAEDVESRKPHLAGFVVREKPPGKQLPRRRQLGDTWCGTVSSAMEGIDTRALVRRFAPRGP